MCPRVVPLLHPAAILRGRFADEPVMITHLGRWVRVLKQDPLYVPEDVNQLPPRSTIFPTPAQFQRFADELRQMTIPCLSVDTEEAGLYLICVGLTQLDLATGEVGATLNLPIRLRGGRQAWPRWILEQHVQILDGLLSDETIAKVFHNGVTHDIPIMEQLGFETKGPLYDTMILAHLAYPELKKSLQFTSTLYFGAARWKHLTSEDDELEDK